MKPKLFVCEDCSELIDELCPSCLADEVDYWSDCYVDGCADKWVRKRHDY